MTASPSAQNGSLGWLRDLWERGWLKGLLLVAAVFFAYQPAWHGGFIWDDDAARYPAGTPFAGWAGAHLDAAWTPRSSIIHWFTAFFGWSTGSGAIRPVGYHLVNILLHAFSALLLVKVLRQLKIPGAWLAAAIFALHPVQVESVAWISELKNTLSGVFYLGCGAGLSGI